MLITDAQVHIWRANSPERPWRAGEKSHREPPLEADELLHEMDAAGVNRAILVPPFLDGDRNDLGMLGFRYSFHRPALTPALTEGRVDWLWEGAEKAGVPIMLHVPHSMVHLIDRAADRYPGLKLVMDHLSLPMGKKDEEAFRDLDKLLALATRPNVAVKVSALACYTNDPYPYRKLHPYVRRVFDEFGPRRTFWGSDLSRLSCTYRASVMMFTEEMRWFSADNLEWIMGRGLSQWLDWKPY